MLLYPGLKVALGQCLRSSVKSIFESNLRICPACQADTDRERALWGRCAHTACLTDTFGHHKALEKTDIFLLQWAKKKKLKRKQMEILQVKLLFEFNQPG